LAVARTIAAASGGREERGVRVGAVRLPLVVAELRGGLLPRGHVGPDGDRAGDRLEVEKAKDLSPKGR